jgi:mutator protein MutT
MNRQITVVCGVLLHKHKILMTLRNELEQINAHNKWEFPGGKIEFTETPEKALKREFMEETGRKINIIRLLPFIQTSYWEYDWGIQQTLCFFYLCRLIKDSKPKTKDHHVADIKWFTLYDARKLNSLPGTKEILTIVEKLSEK